MGSRRRRRQRCRATLRRHRRRRPAFRVDRGASGQGNGVRLLAARSQSGGDSGRMVTAASEQAGGGGSEGESGSKSEADGQSNGLGDGQNNGRPTDETTVHRRLHAHLNKRVGPGLAKIRSLDAPRATAGASATVSLGVAWEGMTQTAAQMSGLSMPAPMATFRGNRSSSSVNHKHTVSRTASSAIQQARTAVAAHTGGELAGAGAIGTVLNIVHVSSSGAAPMASCTAAAAAAHHHFNSRRRFRGLGRLATQESLGAHVNGTLQSLGEQ